MSEVLDAHELRLAALVEEFEEARRRGDRVDVEGFAAAHPEHASELRELLPSLVLMETVATHSEETRAQAAALEALPEAIGEYRVLRRIGRGGMGVVYLARQESLGREVALKLLPESVGRDPALLERFQREARVAARLSHPHIVPVFGVGNDGGRPYYAMRYIDGFSLDEILRAMRSRREGGFGRPVSRAAPRTDESGASGARFAVRTLREVEGGGVVPPAEVELLARGFAPRAAAGMILEVAEALEHAHASGVLHRDVKPGNILIDGEGRAWVTDFGLCRIEDVEADLTTEGAALGTLRYMAPEQLDGAADERSDVYALGLVLFELLTLRPAFPERRKARLVRDIAQGTVPRIGRVRRGVPRALQTIVQKATARLSEERYRSAAAFARDLRAFLGGRPIEARPPSAFGLLRLFVERHRLATAVAALSVLLVGVLSAAYVDRLRQEQSATLEQAYAGDLAAAEAALRDGAIERARRHLDTAPPELRAWEWAHLDARVDQALLARDLDVEVTVRAVLDPTGTTLAVTSDRGLLLLDPDTLEPLAKADVREVQGVTWSTDGKRIAAVVPHGHIHVFERTEDGGLERIHRSRDRNPQPDGGTRMAWVGETLVIGTERGVVSGWTPSTDRVESIGGLAGATVVLEEWREGAEVVGWWGIGILGELARGRRDAAGRWQTELWSLDLEGEAPSAAAWTGSGPLFVTTTEGSVFRVDDGEPRRLASLGARLRAVVRVGDRLVVGGQDKLLHVLDAQSGREYAALSGSTHPVNDLEARPGTREVFSCSEDGRARRWTLDEIGGGQALFGHLNDVSVMAFDRSGRRLATGGRDGQAIVWDLVREEPVAAFPDPAGWLVGLAFDEAEDTLVTAVRTGLLEVWSLATGGRVRASGGTVGGLIALVDVPDSAHLVVFGSDGVARIDSRTLEPSGPVLLAGEGFIAATFDAESGHVLAFSRHGVAAEIDPVDWSVLRTVESFDGYPVFSPAVGPPGTPAAGLALCPLDGDRIGVFDRSTLELRRTLENQRNGLRGERLMSACFGPRGERILCTTRNGLLSVWALDGDEPLVELRGHERWAMEIGVSPGRDAVVTLASDRTARVWRTTSTAERARERNAVEALAHPAGPEAHPRPLTRDEHVERLVAVLASTSDRLSPSNWLLLSSLYRFRPNDPRTAAVRAVAVGRTWGPEEVRPVARRVETSLAEDDPLRRLLAEQALGLEHARRSIGRLLRRRSE